MSLPMAERGQAQWDLPLRTPKRDLKWHHIDTSSCGDVVRATWQLIGVAHNWSVKKVRPRGETGAMNEALEI